MKIIQTPNMPIPKGHYSTCVEHNGLLYLSGQLPFKMGTRDLPEGIEAQTQQVLSNIDFLLKEAGSAMNQILQVRIYIPNVGLWGVVNEIYAAYLGDHKPARCIVPSRELHYGCLIEVECVAFV